MTTDRLAYSKTYTSNQPLPTLWIFTFSLPLPIFIASHPLFPLYKNWSSVRMWTGSILLYLIQSMMVVTSPCGHLKHWLIYPAAHDPTRTPDRYNLFKKNISEGHRKEGRKAGLARHLWTLKEAQNLDRCYGNHYLNGFPLFCFYPFGVHEESIPVTTFQSCKI